MPVTHVGVGEGSFGAGSQSGRWERPVASGCRTGMELEWAWDAVQGKALDAARWLRMEFLEGALGSDVASLGGRCTNGDTRRAVLEAQDQLHLRVLKHALSTPLRL